MSKISVKTRGNSSPQGKPRVYFSAHPADYGLYFEPISNEILKLQNCAIYYEEEPGASYDKKELFLSLSQMQLFVLPITTKLLTTGSRALDVEFKYAKEHRIPVLPLMQEDGLDELFNKKFGNLQFLTKNQNDATELPYKEKLEKYLSSVLIGDELAAKVRAAFDAYIFLSYRKKDRKYAQELMRLIHKNEFCRDIAIWYDEFLTPGENFNDAIGEAIQKSSLFALTVTPNLVNEQNYVMTTEYPMAKIAKKSILPVEMVKTNRAKLKKNYADFPLCTKCTDESGLSSTLAELLRDIAITENDKDPQHNFFIGLAYLGGIDVEVDHDRALQLITSAAEAEFPEAIEKIVAMYRYGEGTERNNSVAIEWQKKLLEIKKEEFDNNPNENSAKAYLDTIWNLGDYICEQREIKAAKKVYNRLFEECMFIDEHFCFSFAKRYVMIGYRKLGDISEKERDIEKASEYYTKSFVIAREINEANSTVCSKLDMSICYSRIGDIVKAKGHLDGAKVYYMLALEINEMLVKELGTVTSRLRLSTTYNKIGSIDREKGDLESAKEYYTKSFDIGRSLVEENGTAESRRCLSTSCIYLGYISAVEGNLTQAKEYYLKSFEIRMKIAEETRTIESIRDIRAVCTGLVDVCVDMGENDVAKMYYSKMVKIDAAIENGIMPAFLDAEQPGKTIKKESFLSKLFAKFKKS